ASTPADVVALVQVVVGDAPATAGEPTTAPSAAPAAGAGTGPETGAETGAGTGVGTGGRSLVAVTACPTGIAHTYMAAEALEAAAAKAGVPIAVETQGSAGSKPLPAQTIAEASAVIFAVDVGVRDR